MIPMITDRELLGPFHLWLREEAESGFSLEPLVSSSNPFLYKVSGADFPSMVPRFSASTG